ncbi:MAG: hypothetical protein KZQ66_13770 [Candidatus Thiodiazotropha sp. (ex Lucinoma aequizonata)]|nr:hypothetical protein [Candidatus Thiodiazotropha sp. (ex Lucinoma aequizonata)]MCU7886926.1 hypothetical protein [Candidatus Thiodiazotropha sp. (ex Lucinoma aequizonata)]MCU7893592.1 hypothetical protein [Candidatus Thiodiazotropha sp. (ex Lucinoma aequizonata)]MCU7899229.1 hypothetical protein [Candidatus Thiodiazotropha sp. (ex Lucinoma aequizonata)]MCU7902930.1 hypothetical protein [Candidatus Thiodiazotropha sp. (ex Lucinoma aequizonata)]
MLEQRQLMVIVELLVFATLIFQALHIMFKLGLCAEKKWRRFRELLSNLVFMHLNQATT